MATNRALGLQRTDQNIKYGRGFYTGYGDKHISKIDPEDFDYFPPKVKKRLRQVFFNIHNELEEISKIVDMLKDDELNEDYFNMEISMLKAIRTFNKKHKIGYLID